MAHTPHGIIMARNTLSCFIYKYASLLDKWKSMQCRVKKAMCIETMQMAERTKFRNGFASIIRSNEHSGLKHARVCFWISKTIEIHRISG